MSEATDDIAEKMARTLNMKQRIQARDHVFMLLERAEGILHEHFGSVGVAELDDCRKTLIEEEFPDD